MAMAIQHYRLASEYAPKQGPDRARVFREYGMVLRTSGRHNAHRIAADQLETALKENQNDPICAHALGDCYFRLGNYQRALELLLPLLENPSAKTRQVTYPLLLEIYERMGEMVKVAELKDKMANDNRIRR